MTETSSLGSISPRLQRVAQLARDNPGMVFTTLAHHIDETFLKKAYDLTRKDGAPGIDGETGAGYATNLEDNLKDLLNRAKSGTYRAPPVRRAYIPKGNGEKRPLGIPTFEDKILQRAVKEVLEAVYEQDFKDCSWGFRPGRDAHGALKALWDGVMGLGGCWLLEVDIRKFFDTVDHVHLRNILDQRIGDGVVRRLIGKWLNAGVMEGLELSYPQAGTPQGGVISPLLANVYLHEVLDTWFERDLRPRMKGRVFLVRYADDFVIGIEREEDAHKIMGVLPKRFEKYGLTLHPDKTRLIDFRRPDTRTRLPGEIGAERPTSFDFLAFTHVWGRSRRGMWVMRQLTAKDRFARALRKVVDFVREHRHMPIKEQHRLLCLKVKGHYGYFGLTGNMLRVASFRAAVRRAWYTWLNRRSEKPSLTWSEFDQLELRWPLPPPCLPRSVFRRPARA
jgi:RNA-directed DNA polymerase